MIKYVLDTNTLSALMDGDQAVIDRFAAATPSDVWTPQPALAEIAFGISRLGESKRRRELEQRRDLLAAIQHMPWTDEVTEAFGQIKATLEKQGTRLEDFDVAIAAHAVAAGAVLVTSNIKHMKRVPGLTVEDWSEDAAG
ncbi:MAG: PIN domain-containing protein [Acidimicrobiia bacterium]